MKVPVRFFVALSVLALAVFSIPMLAQNQTYPFPGYPPQFAPSRTARPVPTPFPRSASKFHKVDHAVPNQYIVVLNDDAVPQGSTGAERRASVTEIAKRMLPPGAEIQSVYGSALRGFCVKLPNEAAAIALSLDARVKYVESDGLDVSFTDALTVAPTPTPTPDPEWLDRLDQMDLPLDGSFTPNRTGSGVKVYDIGTGARTDHSEFATNRAFIAADEIATATPSPTPLTEICNWLSSTNNDCNGHGTAMLGLIGGTTYGVAKSATVATVKVAAQVSTNLNVWWVDYSGVLRGIEWITDHHQANPTQLEVANCSFHLPSAQGEIDIQSINDGIENSSKSGVSYTVAAGNDNQSLSSVNTAPQNIDAGYVLMVGAENQENDQRLSISNYGNRLSLWSPGYNITSANSDPNNQTSTNSSTSRASAIAAGVVALYLQGRTGMSNCSSHPITGESSSTTGTAISTCPDRVYQFIMANSTLNRLATTGSGAIGTGSPNRLAYTGAIPTTTNFNPIDNQRFFVWQHYADFEDAQPMPDENGLDYWTRNITDNCGTGVNVNDLCTDNTTHTLDWRVSTSLAFWVDPNGPYASWFTTSFGLASYTGTDTANQRFVKECYRRYLRRIITSNNDSGVQYWVNDVTNNYGGDPTNAAGVRHLIQAFITSGTSSDPGYRQRFGS